MLFRSPAVKLSGIGSVKQEGPLSQRIVLGPTAQDILYSIGITEKFTEENNYRGMGRIKGKWFSIRRRGY